MDQATEISLVSKGMNVDIGHDFRKCEALQNPKDVNRKNMEKFLFLLDVCGADWQWDWEAEGRIFSSDLRIPLNKMEVVLRNENIWCSQQVERYEEN